MIETFVKKKKMYNYNREKYYVDERNMKVPLVNCNLPIQKCEFAINLDRQDRDVYDYHNVTRVAAILNHVMYSINEHVDVEHIFRLFLKGNSSDVIKCFVIKFQEVFEKYIRLLFSTIGNIVFHRAPITLTPNSPIFCWYANSILFVTFNEKYLSDLLNNISSMLFGYGEDNIIQTLEENYGSLSTSNKFNFSMNQSIEMVSARISNNRTNCSTLVDNFYRIEDEDVSGGRVGSCGGGGGGSSINNTYDGLPPVNLLFNGRFDSDEYNNTSVGNRNSLDDDAAGRQNFSIERNNIDFILNKVFKIQKNIGDVYSRKNMSKLIILHSIYYILENVTKSITTKIFLGADEIKEIDKTTIKVNFKRKVQPKSSWGETKEFEKSHFTHDPVSVLPQ